MYRYMYKASKFGPKQILQKLYYCLHLVVKKLILKYNRERVKVCNTEWWRVADCQNIKIIWTYWLS